MRITDTTNLNVGDFIKRENGGELVYYYVVENIIDKYQFMVRGVEYEFMINIDLRYTSTDTFIMTEEEVSIFLLSL